MLSGDKKTTDITGSTSDNLCDSLAMNFESTRIVVGTRRNDDTGNIKIYNYDSYDSGTGTANTWVLAQTITGNSSSKFGKSVDMNYDGNRIVVGAPDENKVYVYDATSSSANEWATYVSNTLTGTSSSDFGWSVSIAKDNPTKLAIGSPSENKAYMYELSGSTWSQTWSNIATDVPNKVPLTESTDVYMNSNNASYGYSVDLSTFGKFLAIGAPGVLTTITSANSTYSGSTTFGDNYYEIGERLYGIAKTGGVFQRGYIRCFTTSNVSTTWQHSLGGSGTTGLGEVTQHGQLVYGSTVSHLGNFVNMNGTESWSLAGLGFSVSISFDGSKLVGGEPFYSVPGHQASIHKGKVRAWIYDDTRTSDKFQELTSSAATWFGDKFGYAVKLDYDGGRLAVGSTKRWSGGSFNEQEDHGGIHVFDFSETAFYEVSQGNNDFSNETSHVAIAITNGKTVACGVRDYLSSYSGRVRFYHMVLTQTVIGNTLTGGYLAADSVFIGPNDNLENNSFRKRLSFGGTFNDNKYEAAEIENRSFSTDLAHEGHSELFMVKKSVGSGGTGGRDMIRLKANEFQIHNYITRGSSTDDNKYDMYPRLTMSEEGNFKLNPEFLYGRENSSTYSSCDVKALLDINGDTFCRGKLNAGYKDRSNTRGFNREQGIIFYDTRDRDIINGSSVTSHVMSELQRENNPGSISNSVTYNDTESAFKLGSTSSRIHNDRGGYALNHEGLKYSCWIKLTKNHDLYSSSGETILSAGNLSGHYSKCQIYSGGVQILYNSGYKLQKSVTFIKDKWYHLFFYLNARQNVPTTSNNYLWIDGVSQTLTGNTTGGSASAPSSANDNFYVGSTSDSIVDAYIGMVHARNTNNGQNYVLSPSDLYTNGPPSERLSVGGDATIENRLGVGTISPAYELDVTGDINLTGDLRINGISQTFGGGGGGGSSVWTVNSGYAYYNSGNVGIGISTPAYELDVVGDINISSGSRFRINGVAQTFDIDSNNTFTIKTANIERFRIDSNGDTTIGQDNDIGTGHRLTVVDGSTSNDGSYADLVITNMNEHNNARLLLGTPHNTDSTSAFKAAIIADGAGSYSRCDLHFCLDQSTNNTVNADINDSKMTIKYATGNVGIGTTGPGYKLDVNGDINMSTGSSFRINGVAQTFVGASSQWTQSGSDIYRPSGMVGILNTNPSYPLDVTGDINVTGGLHANGAAGTSGQVLTSSGGGAMSWTNKIWSYATVASHPTVTMTSASTSGYVASASSSIGSGPAYYAFNNIIGAESWYDGNWSYTGSPTGTYTGSISTTYNGSTTVDGEWIQLQVPTSITIDSIKIAPENFRSLNAPTEGKILGSTNGSTWTLIHSFTGQTYTDGQYTTISFSNSVAYSYFRLCVERTGGGFGAGSGGCKIGELKFNKAVDTYYNGNVGIGTASPGYKLDVNGDINMSTGSSFRINGVAQTFGGGGGGSSPWTTSGSNIYRSSGQVNIGGSTFTRAKLEVNGSYNSFLTYRYYAYGSYSGIASGTNSYSIYASQRVACAEFNAFSDSRIKKNITDINDSSALDKIRLLEPKIYNYIDEKDRGTSNVYGFIAQEVANVLPYAVTISEGDIPNILTNSNVSVTSDSKVLELRLDTTVEGLTLSNTSIINIITDKDKDLKCNVLSFSESNVITIENTDEFSNVTNAFIKGEQISDFHHLNKDAIWAVSTAALQEVDRQLQAEKTKVATLETQVANLLARVTALENN